MTAFGTLEDIPQDMDVLVAGTPCVDFSSLNSYKKQDFHFDGDIGQLFKKTFPKKGDDNNGEANQASSTTKKAPKEIDQEGVQKLIPLCREWLDGDCLPSLKTQGQSGAGFFGMLSYVKYQRPKMVILENVCSAPWEQMTMVWFPAIDYVAKSIKVDTKNYYIPQNRTRGYLLAIDTQYTGLGEDILKVWSEQLVS